jgi:outer membrane protein OmpA-like peptidoglycan-associated protein
VYIAVSKSTTTGFACLQKWCWGSNSSGQLASNTTTVGAANVMPVKFKTGTNFSSGGGSGGSGPVGGGGNTPTLAALGSVVITEEAGLTAKTTVTGLLAGGRISVFVQEKGWRPAMGATEYPISIRGAVDSSTATLRGVVFGGMSPGAAARVEPFVVGKTYDINVNQFVGSAFSPTVVREFTFTGNVAAAAATTADAETIAPVAKPTVAPAPAVVPGVTVTDAKVYTKSAPKKVATGSAIAVMTPAQAKVNDVVSLTPRICLAAEDDLVFIQTGRCVAQVVNEKTGRVLRALTTRVVADEVSELNVGNEIVTLAPIYFTGGSAAVDANAKKRLKDLTDRISAAGTVLLVGHSGILMGNTPENQQLGRARAIAARNELRSMGAKGPFYFTSAGALAPATTKMTNEAQAKNRRVVIVLIP